MANPLSQTWCMECDKVGFKEGEWDSLHGICKRCSKRIYPPVGGLVKNL